MKSREYVENGSRQVPAAGVIQAKDSVAEEGVPNVGGPQHLELHGDVGNVTPASGRLAEAGQVGLEPAQPVQLSHVVPLAAIAIGNLDRWKRLRILIREAEFSNVPCQLVNPLSRQLLAHSVLTTMISRHFSIN